MADHNRRFRPERRDHTRTAAIIDNLRDQVLWLKHDLEMAQARPPKFDAADLERAALQTPIGRYYECPYCRTVTSKRITLLQHFHCRHVNLNHPQRIPLPQEIPGLEE